MELTLNEALEKGFEAHKSGQLQEAEKLYTAILNFHPKHAGANHNMGELAVAVGKIQEALPLFKTAVEADLSVAQYWLSYIDILIKLDRVFDAQSVLNQAKDKGYEGEEFGQLEENLIDMRTNQVTSQDLSSDQYQYIINLLTQGQVKEALSESSKMLLNFPNSVILHNIAGAVNITMKQFDSAITCFEEALIINPDHAESYNNLGNAYNDKLDLALAIESYKKAVSICPDYADAHYNMGVAFNKQDDREAAIASYKQAIEVKPDFVEAYRHLSALKHYNKRDKYFVKMQELYMVRSLSDQQRCKLSFALGKASEDLNEIADSFSYLKMGNKLRKKILSYDIEKDIELFNQLKRFHPDIAEVALQLPMETGDLKLVFILGMPRSGTTLVEQIISSHSSVKGAGELNHIRRWGKLYVTGMTKPNVEGLLHFRQNYSEALKKGFGASSVVTDKMPINFQYVGLILSAFPNAKVIHVNRDPAATCWSNYKHYFSSKDLGYSYDLDDIVTYYGLYQDLMQFWQGHYRDRIYNLNYDNLTNNQEDETRKLIRHVGLDWEDDCLFPENNTRHVFTASQQQVREKVYQGSSQQWRKFEPFLSGVFDHFESKTGDLLNNDPESLG